MNETKITIWIAAGALTLAIIAFLVSPGRITPSAFLDQGEAFFPDFTDPNEAVTLEVTGFDEATGSPRPFKVTFTGGRWIIPSHHDYPADAKDRLAKTAAGVIGIKKDDIRSDNTVDHEACGVIDPLDNAAPGLTGRGRRITLKGAGDNVLADFIVGREVPNRPGFRFVRVPGQKRVYAVRMDIDLSTSFRDWIETDLLEVAKSQISKVILKDYSINERTYKIVERDNLILDLADGIWSANRMTASQQVDTLKMKGLLDALDSLSIVGVRPKPEGISRQLKKADDNEKMDTQDMLSLQSKGFYFTREGDLKSNEGELQVTASDGVVYTLRFGEVLYGSGTAASAGTDDEPEQSGSAENRYLFITTAFDPSLFPEPERPTGTDFIGKADSLLTDEDRQQKNLSQMHDAWQRKVDRGREKSERLNDRFADWYYVISAASFDRLHLNRNDLVAKKAG